MNDAAGGIAVLAAFALVIAVPIALAAHPRSPDEVVTTGTAGGHTGMAIHPRRGHPLSLVAAWVVALGVTGLGVYYLGSAVYAAAFFIAVGLFLVYLVWSRTSGRAGDGTIILTPDGIHQLWAGSEVSIPWDDVRGLVTTPTDYIVETTAPVRQLHHMPPFLSRRRVVTADAVSLPRRNLPTLPFQEMVELYSTSPAARAELGTDEAIQRARGMLAGAA
jgi:hypothetical protein